MKLLTEYLKRLALCLAGLALYGLGNACGVMAGAAGTNAWSTLAIGIAGRFSLSFGRATFLISLVIIVIAILGKGKIGFATILNILMIPVFSDLWIALLGPLPISGVWAGVLCTLVGQVIVSIATILYMSAALGCGPRDTLMVILGKKLPRIPIGAVKFGLEVAVLLFGVLLGAPFGLGTVLVMALQASIFQLCCRLFRFEPRSLVHEDVPDTVRRIGANKKNGG